MDDKEIIGRVDELIKTERELRDKLAVGQLTAEEEHAALRSVEEALDQCWDLLRQRRGRREVWAGGNEGRSQPPEGGAEHPQYTPDRLCGGPLPRCGLAALPVLVAHGR